MSARTMTAKGEAGWLALLMIGLLVLLGVALYPRPQSAPPQSAAKALQPPAPDTRAGARGQPSAPATLDVTPRALAPEVEQRRQRVLAALPASDTSTRAATRAEQPSDTPAESSALAEEVRVLQRELSPLARACYEQARERDYSLAGTLVLEVTFAHAEGVGGVIESVAPSPSNELRDAALLECVRE